MDWPCREHQRQEEGNYLPDLSQLLSAWEEESPIRRTVASLARGESIHLLGLAGSLPSWVAASLAFYLSQESARPVPMLVVTRGMSEAERVAAEVRQYLPDRPTLLLPPRPEVLGPLTALSREGEFIRLEAESAMREREGTVIVAPAETVRQRMVPRPAQGVLDLRRGLIIPPRTAAERLTSLGYERVPEVNRPGEFAWRGGVMDVYPPEQDPIRVEWFDDEVDSVRTFNPETQRSVDNHLKRRIGPAGELLLDAKARARGIRRISEELQVLTANLRATGKGEAAAEAEQHYGQLLHALSEGRSVPGLQRLQSAFSRQVPLTQLFAAPPLVVYVDAARVMEAFRGQDGVEQERFRRSMERGQLLPLETETVYSGAEVLTALKASALAEVTLDLMAHGHSRPAMHELTLVGRPAPRIHGQDSLLQSELQHLKKARQRVVLVARDEAAYQLIEKRCLDAGTAVQPGLPPRGAVGIVLGQLGHGFMLPELALVVLGEAELSGREIRPQVPRRRYAKSTLSVNELNVGELVVHINHGVGRYLGIRTLAIEGQHKDYLTVQYAGNDTLYVPVEQLNLIQKYVGVEGREPKLSRMGGSDWAKAKEKVRKSVRDMADELVRLYALRESRPGFAFGPDTPWQGDFEAAFAYQETRDQLRAIAEIKADMERPQPMDRLLCGDVGYGKTEVALRAAFKAIMAGKQVAILVPTTLLAEQHYATAKSRMAGYPVEVEVLSRFRTYKEQKDILRRLGNGQVDFLVGTHRLLSGDVKFQDLGLLVIDEEHRFGVAHKERIKQLKANVDVLTLSATPIPRTLHMGLIGIRNMSVIETPPRDRLPVETLVAEFDPDLIREAIRREVDRNGQVFYVQNRIRAIDASVSRLLKMLPDLRVGVVHGQMEETRIEDTMARFIDQEYDVLVTTNIIESGLDIPNANTLVVEDGDKMGLAQLYQLRGRVGRSARLAYAYFTYHRDRVLNPEAEKRLDAIREFTELGAGYQIALRDLEIRGAGNLLGAEQHGYVAAIGFDLYTQLLAQAVRELRGQPNTVRVEPQIELKVDAYLPDAYIQDPRQKILLYKRMVSAEEVETIDEIGDELIDRFGSWPDPVSRLLETARIRVLALSLAATYVGWQRERVMFKLSADSPLTGEALAVLVRQYPGRVIPGNSEEIAIRLEPGKASAESATATALEVLTLLKESVEVRMTEQSG